jgi:hypothetical protein
VNISAIKTGAPGTEVLPVDTPLGFESLYGLGRNIIMLPSTFPVANTDPALSPNVLAADNGDYDISLDFDPNCQGATACHFGSMSGKKVSSNQPESTKNYPYDGSRAVKVTLAKSIQGYYVQGLCGANCDDSRVFFIYNGYQFMFGIKGASQKAVVDLANAAINNSLH